MLQQTQVKTVIPYWNRWMKNLPNVRALAVASADEVLKLWEGLGYYRRVRNLHAAALEIVEQRHGVLPTNAAEWSSLPGVGRYTAGAIASIAFNEPSAVVDGNVTRVLARLYGIRTRTTLPASRDRIWALAETLVRAAYQLSDPPGRNEPQRFSPCSALNQGLMELGATHCSPREPACPKCPVMAYCEARRRRLVDRIPNLAKRPQPMTQTRTVLVLKARGAFLVRQQAVGQKNEGLWEFPSLEGEPHRTKQEAKRLWGLPSASWQNLGTLRHTITRHRITLHVLKTCLPSRPRKLEGRWVTAEEWNELVFSAAHRRLARILAA